MAGGDYMKCTKCGTEFNANFCPNCGTPTQQATYGYGQPREYQNPIKPNKRHKFKWWQALLICLGGFFVLIIIIASFPYENNGSNGAVAANAGSVQEPSSSKSLTSDAIKTDCKILYKDYEDNAISADKKYKDKKLILTGKIANIDRDISKSPYITFNIDSYGAKSIKMSFNDDNAVASLKKGQTVTIAGTCGGTFASTIVVLNNCYVVK